MRLGNKVSLLGIVGQLIIPLVCQASQPPGKPNQLIHEKSPYLLQHAYNPVDWHPWGDKAFQKAKREKKPIFLSIGYSTCHWCHVMEKESFSNPETAKILNEHFIAVKVDREERPDIDALYLTAAEGAGWGGGWPLSLWLTPDLKPFFGGTYFPPEAQSDRPGFKQILEQIARLWKTERDELTSDADRIANALRRHAKIEGGGPPDPQALDNGLSAFEKDFDPAHGGFGGAPKFPMPVNQTFLLRVFARSKDPKALEMVLHTLKKMSAGAIHDQADGGFHRYSTDADWSNPHFEKMLYDNAQLAVNYLEAYQASKDEDLARTARETLAYVLRDMTHPEGGFFSAQDADEIRLRKPRPKRDDKILTSWNGLMISALSKAAQILDDPKYLKAAEKAARFLQKNLYDPKTGRLRRRWREGESKVPGASDDYAFLTQGLLDLYEAGFDPAWLQCAVRLTEVQNSLFMDPKDGGLFMTSREDDRHLLVRIKKDSDGVEPSANSTAALNLLRLAQFTGRKDFRAAAEKTLELFGSRMKEQPRSLPQMLTALDYSLSKPMQIIIAGAPDSPDTRLMLREVHARFLPHKILMVVGGGASREILARWLPFLKGVVPIKGKTTAYVCVNYACALPTNDLTVFQAILDGKKPLQ